MINLNIKEKIPPIENFPNDDVYRVIWAYGSLQKGTTITTVPEIYVLLVSLEYDIFQEKHKLTSKSIVVKISIAQLDTSRYMTIWKGRKRIVGNWEDFTEYKINIKFHLDSTTSSSVQYSKRNKSNVYENLFPQEKYKLPYLGNIENFRSCIRRINYCQYTYITNQ